MASFFSKIKTPEFQTKAKKFGIRLMAGGGMFGIIRASASQAKNMYDACQLAQAKKDFEDIRSKIKELKDLAVVSSGKIDEVRELCVSIKQQRVVDQALAYINSKRRS